ncbi:MAG: MaoC family dehydratase [Candidatus Binatia bacterium]
MSLDGIEIGTEIPRLEVSVSPEEVRRYAIAARMPGQRFLSDEGARKEGLPGQILPGNMSMSLLSRMVLDWLPGAKLEKLGVTFRGLVFPGKPIFCGGFVVDRSDEAGLVRLECDLVLESGGERRITGIAVVSVSI